MKIKDNIKDAVNGQINAELYSAYLYLAMAACLDSGGWRGFARWMKAQAKEEESHAMKLYDYLIESGAPVELMDIKAEKGGWGSPLEVFENVYEHEMKVTGLINGLVELARREGDAATESMLGWFVEEQKEEEETAAGIVGRIKKAGSSPAETSLLDKELGERQAGA